MPENTALIDEIMAALDAENSTNVELIVRNTQNGATKKMALASLEQIIYSYLTTAPVVTNLASVLGVPAAFYKDYATLSQLSDGLASIGTTRSLARVVVSGYLDNTYNPPTSYGTIIKFHAYYTCYMCIAYDGSRMWVASDAATGSTNLTWREFSLFLN